MRFLLGCNSKGKDCNIRNDMKKEQEELELPTTTINRNLLIQIQVP